MLGEKWLFERISVLACLRGIVVYFHVITKKQMKFEMTYLSRWQAECSQQNHKNRKFKVHFEQLRQQLVKGKT